MNLSLYRYAWFDTISFIGKVTGHSSMDNLVEILHVDLSKAADITSSDCSHEQSKEVQSG